MSKQNVTENRADQNSGNSTGTQGQTQENNPQPVLADLEPTEEVKGGPTKMGAGTLILSGSNSVIQ